MGKIKNGFYFGDRATNSYKKFLKKKALFVGKQCVAITYFEKLQTQAQENLLFLDFNIDATDDYDCYTLRLLDADGNVSEFYFDSLSWKYQIETWLIFK